MIWKQQRVCRGSRDGRSKTIVLFPETVEMRGWFDFARKFLWRDFNLIIISLTTCIFWLLKCVRETPDQDPKFVQNRKVSPA